MAPFFARAQIVTCFGFRRVPNLFVPLSFRLRLTRGRAEIRCEKRHFVALFVRKLFAQKK